MFWVFLLILTPILFIAGYQTKKKLFTSQIDQLVENNWQKLSSRTGCGILLVVVVWFMAALGASGVRESSKSASEQRPASHTFEDTAAVEPAKIPEVQPAEVLEPSQNPLEDTEETFAPFETEQNSEIKSDQNRF